MNNPQVSASFRWKSPHFSDSIKLITPKQLAGRCSSPQSHWWKRPQAQKLGWVMPVPANLWICVYAYIIFNSYSIILEIWVYDSPTCILIYEFPQESAHVSPQVPPPTHSKAPAILDMLVHWECMWQLFSGLPDGNTHFMAIPNLLAPPLVLLGTSPEITIFNR